MNYQKGERLYEGKAKVGYSVPDHPDLIWFEYKDSLTAFNAEKKGDFDGKGRVNSEITSLLFRYLQSRGVESHWVADMSPNEMVTKKLEIIPLEVVVRNVLAGSTAKKLGIEEGTELETALVEFYYKDDSLGDPFISDDQALMLKAASMDEIAALKKAALQVNRHLITIFAEIGLRLVDFKLEFGRNDEGQVVLADEITPDTCRLWDVKTGEKMDKDRFRRDLGGVKESYENVLDRLRKHEQQN